jgi:hypothetical protein
VTCELLIKFSFIIQCQRSQMFVLDSQVRKLKWTHWTIKIDLRSQDSSNEIKIRMNWKSAYMMNILPCISGKASSNGSTRSNLSDVLEIFWETARITRWPMNSSFPNLWNKCCTENWASEQSIDPAKYWTKRKEHKSICYWSYRKEKCNNMTT